ncbi:MAG TPA: hypothetical protein VJW95_03065 [Dissulfurispiraceae bacterium]|nr:hypothetical protein [Dissulfurispiraceae bacterium]
MEYYIHHVPGRIRIRTPFLRDKQQNIDQFTTNMRTISGMQSLKVNTATGSALLLYDEKKVNCEQLIGILEKYGYFNLAKSTTCDELIEHISEKALGVAEEIIVTAMEGGVPEA